MEAEQCWPLQAEVVVAMASPSEVSDGAGAEAPTFGVRLER